jgi:serine protease inhibitor
MKRIVMAIILFVVCTDLVAKDNPSILAQELNTFAFAMYKEVQKEDQNNLIFSPYSLSLLLMLLSQGVSGVTQSQIMSALNLPLEQNNTFEMLNQIERLVHTTSPCKGMRCIFKKMGYSLHLSSPSGLFMANGIWVQADSVLNANFLSRINRLATAKLYQVDFKQDPEAARKTLNNWAAQNTREMINNLLFPGVISASTKMVSVNAVYFKGLWEKPFSKLNTHSKQFKLMDHTSESVQMMQQINMFSYFENDAFQMLILPYSQGQLAMAVILPKPNSSLQAVLQFMNGKVFDTVINQGYLRNNNVFMPRFTLSSSFYNLIAPLQSLGIKRVFTQKADFSRLSDASLLISEVVQRSIIKVNEAGTRARLSPISKSKEKPIIFMANHPFLFLVFDRKTHLILFIGQTMNPNLE